MNEFTLAIVGNNPSDFQMQSWSEFEKVMRKAGDREAIIFFLSDNADQVSLAKRILLSELILKKDNVKHLTNYCLINHKKNNNLQTCMILLDPELNYAAIKAIQFYPNDFFIQCLINDKGVFSVNKCPLEVYDSDFNDKVN